MFSLQELALGVGRFLMSASWLGLLTSILLHYSLHQSWPGHCLCHPYCHCLCVSLSFSFFQVSWIRVSLLELLQVGRSPVTTGFDGVSWSFHGHCSQDIWHTQGCLILVPSPHIQLFPSRTVTFLGLLAPQGSWPTLCLLPSAQPPSLSGHTALSLSHLTVDCNSPRSGMLHSFCVPTALHTPSVWFLLLVPPDRRSGQLEGEDAARTRGKRVSILSTHAVYSVQYSSSGHWYRIAPRPLSDVSVWSEKGKLKFGYASTGGLTNISIGLSRVCWWFLVHSTGVLKGTCGPLTCSCIVDPLLSQALLAATHTRV